MPFAENTYLKVIKYLNMPIKHAETVHAALIETEVDENVVSEVNDLLAELAIAEAKLKAELSSTNHALIQADVVKWEAGTRAKGLHVNYANLRQQLANLLNLEWYRGGSGIPGTTSYPTTTVW
jgi:hypothetical protein